jgi:hypothetical protein
VFEDLGVPNAEEHFVKAQLVFKIDTIMKKRHMKQIEAAALFGVRQPDISKMVRGEFVDGVIPAEYAWVGAVVEGETAVADADESVCGVQSMTRDTWLRVIAQEKLRGDGHVGGRKRSQTWAKRRDDSRRGSQEWPRYQHS